MNSKTMLSNKDNSCGSLYTQYSLLCVFISQYSNKDDFVSMGETRMAAKRGQVPNWGQGSLTSPWTALVLSALNTRAEVQQIPTQANTDKCITYNSYAIILFDGRPTLILYLGFRCNGNRAISYFYLVGARNI